MKKNSGHVMCTRCDTEKPHTAFAMYGRVCNDCKRIASEAARKRKIQRNKRSVRVPLYRVYAMEEELHV